MDAPLLMMPRGFLRDTRTVQGRDAQGRRTKQVRRRHADDGGLGGWEDHHHDGRNDATVTPRTVTVTLSASMFGLTVEELRRVVATQLQSRPPRTPSGLWLP